MSRTQAAFSFYDSHLHLPTPDRDGIDALLRLMEAETAIWGGNLILNTPQEVACVCENLERLPSGLVFIPYLAAEGELPETLTCSGWYKVHPTLMEIGLEDIQRVLTLVKSLKKRPRGLVVHCFPWGTQLQFSTGLELVLALAQEFPDMRVLATHGGGYDSWRFHAHTRSLGNVFYDFSVSMHVYRGTDCVRPFQADLREDPERLLFGSDWPSGEPGQQLAECTRLAGEIGISAEQVEQTLNANARRLWGDGLEARCGDGR